MDPNKALEIAREELERMHAFEDSDDALEQEAALEAAREVAEAFSALDEWISRGGFLPTAWATLGSE